jgi:glycerol-3-phosphate acyltransferase PlsX
MLKAEIKRSFIAKLGYLLSSGAFKRFKKRVDYAEYGGAPLLGIEGVGMICHGGSNAKAIKNAVRFANEYARRGVTRHLADKINHIFSTCAQQSPPEGDEAQPDEVRK